MKILIIEDEARTAVDLAQTLKKDQSPNNDSQYIGQHQFNSDIP